MIEAWQANNLRRVALMQEKGFDFAVIDIEKEITDNIKEGKLRYNYFNKPISWDEMTNEIVPFLIKKGYDVNPSEDHYIDISWIDK